MLPRKKKLALLFLLTTIVSAWAGWIWLTTEDSTAEQEETLEKIKLLGSLRADWYLARGTMTETEAVKEMRAGSGGRQAVHLLFLGVDRRKSEPGRADAIHLLRFEPGQITLLSIPRDSLFSFRGDTIADKLNHTYAAGGAASTIRAIETLLKIKMDGYLEVDLQTFLRVAQIAKTLTLNGRLIGAEQIFEHIDGLLSWLRNRSFPGGDIRRIARQHLFIGKSLDGILTLYQKHPGVFNGVVNGALKLLPGSISSRQVMVLCQIYSEAEGGDTAAIAPGGAWSFAKHRAVRNMERYILPGQTLLIDIQSGRAVPPPIDTHHVARGDTRALEQTVPDTRIWYVWRGSAAMKDSHGERAVTPPGDEGRDAGTERSAFMEETGVISFYRVETGSSLDQMLADWRRRKLRKNYEDKDELLR